MKKFIAKKFIATLTAVVIIMTLATIPVFAATSFTGLITDYAASYTDVQGTNDMTSSTPVYGYVGTDATITDNDTSNPNTAPTFTAYQIDVSVPVKIIWAAFSSDDGPITAPDYTITNNSSLSDVTVTLVSFTARSTPSNTAVDDTLTLNLTGNEMAMTGIFAAGIGTTGNTIPFGGATNPTKLLKMSGNTTNPWTFSFDGSYDGGFTTASYTPVYDMVLQFATAP